MLCVCVCVLCNMQLSYWCLSTEGHARIARQILLSSCVPAPDAVLGCFLFKDHMLMAESRTYCQPQPCSAGLMEYGIWAY